MIGYMTENLLRTQNVFRPFYERGSGWHAVAFDFLPSVRFAMLLPAAIPALVLTWSRIDRVVIVGMHAHSRALDVTAPPPRAR